VAEVILLEATAELLVLKATLLMVDDALRRADLAVAKAQAKVAADSIAALCTRIDHIAEMLTEPMGG